jgi:hypothetical protein
MLQARQNLRCVRELELHHRFVPEPLNNRLRLFVVDHLCKPIWSQYQAINALGTLRNLRFNLPV